MHANTNFHSGHCAHDDHLAKWSGQPTNTHADTKNTTREKKIWIKTFIVSCLWRRKFVSKRTFGFFSSGVWMQNYRQHASIFTNNNHKIIISLFKSLGMKRSEKHIPHFKFLSFRLETISWQMCFDVDTRERKCMQVDRQKDRNYDLKCFQNVIPCWPLENVFIINARSHAVAGCPMSNENSISPFIGRRAARK